MMGMQNRALWILSGSLTNNNNNNRHLFCAGEYLSGSASFVFIPFTFHHCVVWPLALRLVVALFVF
jgi:hypothetical protein